MFIQVERLSKRFAARGKAAGTAGVAALKSISLGIEHGRMLSLVGPSGSGKTTLLRCIAGLEEPDEGHIRIGERVVFSAAAGRGADSLSVPTERRNLGLIFQSYALWPNMTVEGNVAYPLKRRSIGEAEIRTRVARYLDLVGCAALAERYPHELSGGQQQRIALARALVYEPAVVLFDEPLSNLDPALRDHLRAQIRDIQRSVGFTGVYVTHDQAEAFYVGDKVAILHEGDLIQVGTPDDIYHRPTGPRIAHFVGATNRTIGRVVQLAGGGRAFESADIGRLALAAPQAAADGRSVVLMLRPESIRLRAPDAGAPQAQVHDRILIGAFQEYVLRMPGGALWRVREAVRAQRFAPGTPVQLEIDPAGALLYDAATLGSLENESA